MKYAPSLEFFKKVVLEIISRIDLLQDLVIFQEKKEQKIVGNLTIIGDLTITGQTNKIEEIQENEVEKELNKYLKLNTPLDFEDMEVAGVLGDYKTYIKEAKTYLKRSKEGISLLAEIPKPSEKLEEYFNNR